MNGMFYRGEVYYVYPTGNEIGSEQHAGRPAIIVSNNHNNKNSSTLEIVYLTTREKKPMQTHVHINAAGKLQESTALCEQIFTVDKLRLNDYIGQLCDKEMNSMFCRTDRPIEFRGTMNEDITTYTTLGSRGVLFMTFTACQIIQIQTQTLKGGMTDAYKESGTYSHRKVSAVPYPEPQGQP